VSATAAPIHPPSEGPARAGTPPLDLDLRWSLDDPDLLVGVVLADGLDVRPSEGDLAAWLDAQVATVADPPEPTRQAIRQLLKRHGFKATGRNKPASEYLAEARRAAAFPRILDVVDVNNALSLETGWPMSVLDLDRCLAASPARARELRPGRDGESYVFNPAGHAIDLANLLLVAAVDGPALGNPVKDAMTAKVGPGTQRIAAFLYASRKVSTPDDVLGVARRFADRVGGGVAKVLSQP